MKPNIFEISTKELSQDAFITWLIQWSEKDNKNYDEILYTCAVEFVKTLIKKEFPDFNEEIDLIRAGRQWENIDVWAEVNNKYLIIIEDKTFSNEHSNQLNRYKKTSEDWCESQNPKYFKPICIYLKTGNESNGVLSNVSDQGFHIIVRKDLIDFFQPYKVSNDIMKDFISRLNKLEQLNNQWNDKILRNWEYNDWQGFFKYIEENSNLIIRWFYVQNPSGGFWCALLSWDDWGDYPVYMQIEEKKLCIKVSTDDIELPENTSRSDVRNKVSQDILIASSKKGLSAIRKPDRFGTGRYMTVAIIDSENWLGNEDSYINPENAISNIKKYKSFLLETIYKN
jgi:hypothetical protein